MSCERDQAVMRISESEHWNLPEFQSAIGEGTPLRLFASQANSGTKTCPVLAATFINMPELFR